MKYLKGRLTYHEENGDFGVAGMNEGNQDEKIHACIAKLKDYEDLGFHPSDMEMFLKLYDEMVEKLNNAQKGIDRSKGVIRLLENELSGLRNKETDRSVQNGF